MTEHRPKLPFELGVRSNGEYLWLPSERDKRVAQAAHDLARDNAKRVGMDRRSFLASSAGMVSTLAAVNACSTQRDDGPYQVDEVSCDHDGARELLSGAEFIFDVQTHHVDLDGTWRETNLGYKIFYDDMLPALARDDCDGGAECFDFDQYVDLVFGQSDTTVAVLSGVPAVDCQQAGAGEMCGHPIDNAGMAATRDRINALAGSERLVSHAMVTPNTGIDAALARMAANQNEFGVRAWKLYTPWGPIPPDQMAALEGKTEDELLVMALSGDIKGTGFWLDDPDMGIPVIERGLELGVNIFCIHKGLPLPTFDPNFTSSRDIGALAPQFPAASFVVYHSSFNTGAQSVTERLFEGPYDGPDADPAMANKGINDLINALRDNDVPTNSNVYAELGGVWSTVMSHAEEAQHVIGKLLKYVGDRRVLWGTDCVWSGTPQPYIEAFRAFEITGEFQDKYGYPPLTPQIKAQILGLNAAELYGIDPGARRCALSQDELALRRGQRREMRRYEPHPRPTTLGPRSRREFFRLWWDHRNEPG